MIALENGQVSNYALKRFRSEAFSSSSRDKVYAGQVVGENSRPNDLVVNPCKGRNSIICARHSRIRYAKCTTDYGA